MDRVEQTNESWRIHIVEHDEPLAEQTREYLESYGLAVSVETHGSPAAERIRNEQPDLVVLDLMLPGEDGLSICRRVRPFYSGPIIMLTARTDDLDQVLGLEMGADDYISKPVKPRVLLARIRAMLRRVTENAQKNADEANGEEPSRLQFNDLVVDRSMREAWLSEESIDLTSAEFDLLWLLVLSREEIFTALRGIEYDGQDRSIDVRVSRIRPKIGDDPVHPRRIKTVRSKGYLFVKEA
jgi:two-component system response regulator RstA